MSLHRKKTLAKLKQTITDSQDGSLTRSEEYEALKEAVTLIEEYEALLAKVAKNLSNARKANRDYNKSIRKDKSYLQYWTNRAMAAEDKVHRSIVKICELEDFLKELGLGLQTTSLLKLSAKQKAKKERQEKLEKELMTD